MSAELSAALHSLESMAPAAVVEARRLIGDLVAIKRQIENRARALGYSERCRQAIPVCRGECCRWHFPKTINRIDFFIAAVNLSAVQKAAVAVQVQPIEGRTYQCPLLRDDGCIFSFENRPVACTNAFPCMAGSDYWQYKETFREDIDTLRQALGRLIDRCVDRHR